MAMPASCRQFLPNVRDVLMRPEGFRYAMSLLIAELACGNNVARIICAALTKSGEMFRSATVLFRFEGADLLCTSKFLATFLPHRELAIEAVRKLPLISVLADFGYR